MPTRDGLIARVTARVHAPATPEGAAAVGLAVDAAVDFVAWITGADPLAAVPRPALVDTGLEAFAVRLYLDPSAPSGALGVVGDIDGQFGAVPSPEDLYRHVHHYFDHLAVSWGFA